MPGIMTLGEIIVEFLAEEKNQTFCHPGRILGPYPGGAAAIFIDQIGKLGSSCGIIGCVGDDDFAHLSLDRLKTDGVTIDFVKVLTDNTTGSSFVTRKDDGSYAFINYIHNAACSQINTDMITPASLSDCKIFHIIGASLTVPKALKATRRVIELVKSNGGKISFDPCLCKEFFAIPTLCGAFLEIIQQADIILPGDGELNLLLGCDDSRQAIEKVFTMSRTVQEIIIKYGPDGCCYYGRKGNSFQVPGFKGEDVDVRGARDSFDATYIHFSSQQTDVQQALKYANAAWALATATSGSMEGNATQKELDDFIALHE